MRRITGVLLALLLLAGCGSRAAVGSEAPGSEPPPPESAARMDVTGEWHRTDCHSECGATLTISDQTAEGFRVTAECQYFSHSGELEGEARFTEEGAALLEDYGIDGEAAPVTFQWEGESLSAFSGTGGGALGFGANVTIDGTYTRGEPAYTNEGMLERCLTEDQRAELREVLDAAGYADLEFSFAGGLVEGPEACVLADGTAAERYEILYPTMSWYDLTLILAEDGRLYGQNAGGFFTNDPNAGELPEV